MGEGVTNPTDSAVEGPSALWAACLKLVLLLGLSYFVALRWKQQGPDNEIDSDAGSREDTSVDPRGENPTTSLTGNTTPHPRRSVSCGIVSQIQPVAREMEENAGAPPDPQPDSFFTWDSGGSSGEYSFVHTAVELPKYPDGAISEEERQMLLLYMQSGHPELLLSSANGSADGPLSILGPPPPVENVLCDQATVRGFLETIVEENSDDLVSPSDCDENSVGWGSWDESDDDRVTVVEMETSDQDATSGQCGMKRELDDSNSEPNPKVSKREKLPSKSGYHCQDVSGGQNITHAVGNQLDGCDFADSKKLASLSGASSVNNCVFENGSTGCEGVTGDSSAEHSEVSERNIKSQNDFVLDTKPKVSPTSVDNSDFESLWISANNPNVPDVQTISPWSQNEGHFIPSPPDIQTVDLAVKTPTEITDGNSLLVLGSNDLCLVPSGASDNISKDSCEKLTFSDDFKDYFLPTDSCVPSFKLEDNDNFDDMFVPENKSNDSKVRCFRIGFESEPLEIINDDYYNPIEKPCPENTDAENYVNRDFQQETLFSPRDGDVVYGSSWLGDHASKTPEKPPSSAEAHFSPMHSESPPTDNNRKSLHLFDQSASDDELQQVPNSLSRWQHHTDLQHVQEATSPLTRWQHQSDLQFESGDGLSKQTFSDEDTDDGLPAQLKEIYSSFKMNNKKMGRIKIKNEDKDKFKKLGLFDNDMKVTLPPFIANNTLTEKSQSINKELIREEDLDDLELDMFSVNKNKLIKSNNSSTADLEIDDALKSFNHLDDYSSNSEENSESENSYTVNTVENIDYDNEDLSNPSTPDMSSLKSEVYNTCVNELIKYENENSCSDNSDNCPLCTDPSFKNSKINDIFSTNVEQKILDNSVQSLLLNTFPKIKSLSHDDKNSETVDEAGNSTSPLTSSDSDEGIRTAKDMKKRIKRRSKDNLNVELKHDDSGYVEDDEDDDEDDSLEEKDPSDPVDISHVSSGKDSSNKVRKSLSSVFYESKSMTDMSSHSECIPKTFEEFSSQLEQSVLVEDVKDGVANKEKWDIPENLSQFSAWLLDKELKKINSRDHMEKLIVNDIMSLREQTISKFLKNSSVDEKNVFLSAEKSETSDACSSEKNNSDFNALQNSGAELGVDLHQNGPKINGHAVEVNSDSDKTFSDGNLDDKVEHSAEELDSEYYNYNYNSNVSKIQDNASQIIPKNFEMKIDTSLSNPLPDIISSAAESSKCSREIEIKNFEQSSNREIDTIDEKEKQITYSASTPICVDSVSINDNLIIQTLTNAETGVEKKLECLSERHRDVDDIESEKRAKVNSTTSSVTSDEEPATNNVEVNDSHSTAEYLAINKACDEPTPPVHQVAPSVEGNSNSPKTINYVSESNLSENNLKTSESLKFSSEEQSKLDETINDSLAPDMEIKCYLNQKELNFENNFVKNDCKGVIETLKDVKNVEVISTNETIGSEENEIDNTLAPVEFCSGDREVAPSLDDVANESATHSGSEIDLLISDPRVGKGAYQAFSNEIISPEAKAASGKVDSETHVTIVVDCHAHDELACITLPVVNDNLCTLPTLQFESGTLSDNAISDSVSKELQKSDLSSEESRENSSRALSPERIPKIEPEKDTSLAPRSTEQVSDFISSNILTEKEEILIERSFKSKVESQLNSLYKSKSVTVLQTEDFEDETDEFSDGVVQFNGDISTGGVNLSVGADENFLTQSTNDIDRLLITTENSRKNASKIKSSDDLSIVDKNRDIREEYTRSRSVGRDTEEEKGTYESWSGQSKSTPDLSRCHQFNSSVPLSALLSKSVSQRIQDYLGKSTRGGVLNRSLPPNERSRHYRRICVSTETVVERAARFEAKSSGREKIAINSRSGSCPPLDNMRTHDVARGFKGYSKSNRPPVDPYAIKEGKLANGVGKKSEEELFELITGYGKASRVTHKPPVPPSTPSLQQALKATRLKGKIASARREFFEKLSQPDLNPKPEPGHSDVDVDERGTCGLRRFDEFRKSAREERARLAQSHPDLGALEAAVRSSRRRIDQLKKRRQKPPPLDAGPQPRTDASMPVTTKDGTLVLPYRRCTGEIAWASCAMRLQEAKSRSGSKSQEPLEIVDERRFKRPAERPLLRAHEYENAAAEDYEDPGPAISGSDFSRARSMDFLLDNREGAEPPENRLAQRVKSEHELRIERSLQNLTLPDWYTQSKKQKEGFILRRGSEGSAGDSRKRWLGFSSSRTPSATSLTTPPSSYSQRNIIIPKRVTPTSGEWRYIGSLVSSRESLTPASPASLSPRECSSAAFNYGFNASLSRWSSSRLSTSSAPLTAASVHRSFRQPYLGWRAAAASSSGGPSRSSPGVSPMNASTPVQGSRPGSPRRGSQDHQYGYGLQQNQVTSAATLRPESNETGDSGSRISPLALYDNSTNVFFNSNVEVPDFSNPEMRRDRYSYTQSLYSGTVIVSPGTEFKPVPSIAEDISPTTVDDRFSMSKSPQPPPRIWMESSFVGSKKDGKDQVFPQGRTIRIVPSDSVRSRDGGSSVRSSCAPQTTMDTRELIDHLHNFLRGLQNRNQMIRPSSNSAFTPVSSSSNSGFHQNQTTTSTTTTTTTTTTKMTNREDSYAGSGSTSTNFNHNQRPNLVNYESEPKAYPRSSWRHSSSSSKDISPDNSSTDNELWLSVGEEMGSRSFSRTPEHLDARSSSRSSISPPSPPARYPQTQKRASEDSTGSAHPIFFASSRRGSKGSNHDPRSEPHIHQANQYSSNIMDSSQIRDECSRKSSSTHSEESGYFRRDSKSGGSNSWRDSRTDQESSSTSKAEKSSASMEEVLESLLAIPPLNSRSSSPTSPRRSRGQSLQLQNQQHYQASKMFQFQDDSRLRGSDTEVIRSQPAAFRPTAVVTRDMPERIESSVEASSEVPVDDDQGKPFDESLNFPPIPCSTTSTTQPLFPLEEVNNHGSFCRSSSTSPLEDDVHSPTSMEVLVPEGEEQDLSSIIEDETKLAEDCKPSSLDHHLYQPLRKASLHECHHHPRPPLRRQSTLPSCSSIDPLSQPPEEEFTNLFAGLQPGRGPSTHEESGTTPRKKVTAAIEGHLKCHRPRCNKSLPAEEARARFRTCPNCYTYYCSRQCRKLHLARHKDHCPQTRISNLCKQVLMKARDDPVSRRHLSLCARRGLLSRGRGAVKLLFLCPEDAHDYLVNGWEAAKGQTLYVSRSDLLPQEMGSDVFSQVRNFCDKYNPERKFILLAAITVTNDIIAQALDREVVVRGAKMHLSPSLPEDDVQTLILTISKTDPQTGDPIKTTKEERRKGLSGVIEQLATRGVDVEKLYPHTFRKITRFVEENEPFSPISIFPTDQRNGRVFMCIILPWADADIIVNISSKGGVSSGKSSKKKWMLS